VLGEEVVVGGGGGSVASIGGRMGRGRALLAILLGKPK
jgi:hypothetical protein